MKKAPVNKIIPFSNVDGPGNRTSIFFQGCSFNCQFCHNPETISLCCNCGKCVQNCPANALYIDDNNKVNWRHENCIGCDNCIRCCPYNASPRVSWMTVQEVMKEVLRCAPYIVGITTSGGECTLYNEFLIDLFTEVRKLRITCLIDSNGSFDFTDDPRILDVCDGVMLDVKAVEPTWHTELVSFANDTVLKNLDYLLYTKKLQEVRTLIFPGRNKENEETVRYVAQRILGHCPYKIIRYRPFGVREKYQKVLGEFTTDLQYAEYYVQLAKECGAEKAFVV